MDVVGYFYNRRRSVLRVNSWVMVKIKKEGLLKLEVVEFYRKRKGIIFYFVVG